MSTPSLPPPPPGTGYSAEWYAPRRYEESTALSYLAHGHPVLLWGPPEQGCSWLCHHLARAWQAAAADRTCVFIDFNHFEPGALSSFDACLLELARTLEQALPEDPSRVSVSANWAQSPDDAKTRLNLFMERIVLPAMQGELLLVFDHATLVHGRSYYEDFATLLRSWAERGSKRPIWKRLRLVVSVSVHPARLRMSRHASPFANLSTPIPVGDFAREQVDDLVRRHGLSWASADIDRVMDVVGGHPYLTCAVIADVRHGHYRLDALASDAPLGRSSVDDHLNRLRSHIHAEPALGTALAGLAKNPAATVTPSVLDELIQLGLVTQAEAGRHPIRYRLYQRLLPSSSGPRKRKVFYSYSHRDEALRDRLAVHLKILERQGLIEPWHDRRIQPGSQWKDEIDDNLEAADLILLLVSADFLASDYCWGVETDRAMQRHDAREAVVVPIILSPCDWMSAPFGKLQALPKDAQPVTTWPDHELAWNAVAQALRSLITR